MTNHLKQLGTLAVLALALAAGCAGTEIGDREVAQSPPAAPTPAETPWIEALQGSAPRDQKEHACRMLGRVGTAASVPALAALLADPELSHMARFALEPMPCPQAAAALRAALATTTGRAKVGVIGSLGARRDAKAVEPLIALLKDPDDQVATAAAGALGRIGTRAAASALRTQLAATTDARRAGVIDGALAAADQLMQKHKAGSPEINEAAKIYDILEGPEYPSATRAAALTGLLAARPAEAVGRAVQALGDKDPACVAAATAALPTIQDPGAIDRLIKELPRVRPAVQVLALDALARSGNPAVLPVMLGSAASADAAVRRAAVAGVGAVGDEKCVTLLVRNLGDSDADVKAAAAAGLRQVRGDKVAGEIVRLLGNAPAGVRAELIEVLVARQAAGAVPALLAQARGPEEDVRNAAFTALGLLAGPADLEPVLQVLTTMPGDGGRVAGERAAAQLLRKFPDGQSRSAPILAALKNASRLGARGSLVRLLGQTGEPEALRELQAILAAPATADASDREAAVRALASWPDSRALLILRGVVQQAPDERQRALALRGCLRLLEMGNTPAEEAVAAYKELLIAAPGAEERKMIASGLGNVPTPEVAALLQSLLADLRMAAETRLALLNVAAAELGINSVAAVAAAQWAAEGADPAVRTRAEQIARQAGKLDGAITAWQVSGPYAPAGKGATDLYGEVLEPEKAGGAAAWRLLPAGLDAGRPWLLDLEAALGGERRVAYMRTWVYSKNARPAQVALGADDGFRLWVNGQAVAGENRGGAVSRDQFKANVKLQAGWNALLLKVTQDSGPWGFSLRVLDPSGEVMEGLNVCPLPPK